MKQEARLRSGSATLCSLPAFALLVFGAVCGVDRLTAAPLGEAPQLADTAGSWAIVTSPNPMPTSSPNLLLGVTCVSASDCWTVGFASNGFAYQTLVQHWDGTAWTIGSSANTSVAQHNELWSVACTSSSNCWAVGSYLNASTYQTLIERWDGVSWSIVPSPNSATGQHNYLNGVACNSASDCWAVGQAYNGGAYQTLVEHWDGISWAIAPSPSTGATSDHYLYGVTCNSSADCWAVGRYVEVLPVASIYQTLIEHWDGTAWSIVSSTNFPLRNNELHSVTCASPSDCWTVGFYKGATAEQTLIQKWDGTSWATVDSPNTDARQINYLYGVTCAASSDCTAAGFYLNDTKYQTIIQRWDGTSWAIVPSANTSPTLSNFLVGVTCTSSYDCWSIAYYDDSGTFRTLTEHYTVGIPPLPTDAVSHKAHGAAGTFDIPLPLTGNPGIECRTGGSSSDHQLVITFSTAVTFDRAALTAGAGAVSGTSGNGTSEITVDLTDVGNAQTITLTLFGVSDGAGIGDVGVRMSVLLGDTTENGTVNSSDIGQAKGNSGQTTTGANFRTDVTVNGSINSSDIGAVKANSGTSLQ